MAENINITDISDKGWDDLSEGDRDVVQELAKERDGIDARLSTEALAAALLAYHGRADEIPDEAAEEHIDVIEEALAASEGADGNGDSESAETPTVDDRETGDGSDEDEDDHDDKTLDNAVEPNARVTVDASFIIDAAIIQTWLDYPDVLVDESRIHIEAEGLRIRAVDPANVGMVETVLHDSAFDSYPMVHEEGVIGVNLERLIDVVGGANAGDLVQLEYVAEQGNLVVRHGGHRFRLALIDPDSIRKEPDLPDLDLPATVTFEESADLKTAIEYADEVSDHIAFGVDPNERVFTVEAEGDTDDYRGQFEDGEEVDIHPIGYARSLFSLDYLKDIRKPWQKDRPLELDIGEEFPLDLRQTIFTDDDEVGEVQYLLAPRIQSD